VHEIYKRVYGNFVHESLSKATFYGPNYSNDPEGIIESIELIRYFAAAHIAIKRNMGNQLSQMSIEQVIGEFYRADLIDEFSFNFNSPGKIAFIALASTLAIVSTIGVGALTHEVKFGDLISHMSVMNSADASTEHHLPIIQQDIKQLMESIGQSRYDELLRRSSKAKRGIGLNTDVKIYKK
jgi:hypothetical protein